MAVRRRIGYMIQEGGLFPHLTARDNATDHAAFPRLAIEADRRARRPVVRADAADPDAASTATRGGSPAASGSASA